MRPLERARRRAREARRRIGPEAGGRLERLCELLQSEYGIRPQAVSAKFLAGSRGEVVPEEGLLYYDEKLDKNPEARLQLFAHELGHLTLHARLAGLQKPGDALRGSSFLDSGAPALERYSRRSREEAEASAFAAEWLCPADEVFAAWRGDPEATADTLAERFGVAPGLCRVQLAEGLYRRVAGIGTDDEDDTAESAEPPPLSMNEEQEEAALAGGQPILVEAGPGTGKTRTLVRRVLHLIEEAGAAPEDLLVLTFSNEAAAELRERVERHAGVERAASIQIATFHGFGIALLSAYGHHLGMGDDIAMLDDAGQEEMIDQILGQVDCEAILNLKNPRQTVERAVHFIGFLKDRLITPSRLASAIDVWRPSAKTSELAKAEALLAIYRAYEAEKRRRDRVDFADLVLLPLELFDRRPDVRAEVRSHARFVMVDEYQDVSRSMALFLRQLCGPDNPPWVVGDARQAIYRFRGAAPENVARFAEDFPGARRFEVSLNYRSSPPVIAAANRLAAWLEGDDGDEPRRRWRPGREVAPFESEPVTLAEASSDAAEQAKIVESVADWLERGIDPAEIGVLARRNIDVRNLALALSEAGIRAITSGLLTAEGAAGDLAAALALLDDPRSAAPRLVYTLGRGHFPKAELDLGVRCLLEAWAEAEKREREAKEEKDGEEGKGTEDDSEIRETIAAIDNSVPATTIQNLRQSLQPLYYKGDGWAVLVAFLFDASPYLRRLLEPGAGPAARVALEETLSALAFAAAHRFAHPGEAPRWSRRRMSARFRERLTSAAPGLVPPRPQAGAVRVMTCHAAKGLEFSCAAVAGQTLHNARRVDSWLPPALRPDPEDDRRQADSLLFVGFTRAERAAVVSWARTAGGKVRSPKRRLPGLLERWRDSQTAPLLSWERPAETPEAVVMGRIWGGRPPETVSLYALSGRRCDILGYLQDELDLDPGNVPFPLYPVFIARARRALRRVIDEANESGQALDDEKAAAIAAEEWPEDSYAEHPHLALYRPRAADWTKRLARAHLPAGNGEERTHELVLDDNGEKRTVPLQLIGHFEDQEGRGVAIAFRPDSFDREHDLRWSDLPEAHRLPLVLLHERDPDLRPLVFAGQDGKLYPYRWSARKPEETMAKVRQKARERFTNQTRGQFEATIQDWVCDRCRCRMLCPYWIGALDSGE